MVKKTSRVRKTSKQLLAGSDQTIEQVRQLAWTGQHARAIEVATEALENVGAGSPRPVNGKRPGKGQEDPAPTIMSLLDLRAESYIAIGKLDLAMKDAKAMGKIAKSVGAGSSRPMLQVQALNRLALVQMRTGDLKAAVKSATAAVKANRQSKIENRKSFAESLFRLAEAQWRARQLDAARKTVQQAIDAYQELGDTSGTGRAYWVLAGIFFRSDRAEESRRAAQTALELCKQAGDSYGIGNALLALANTDVDIAEQIQHYQQAKSAFETVGYVERQGAVIGNLANTYGELGLHAHVRRLRIESVEKDRAMGAKLGLAVALMGLIGSKITFGELEGAHLHLRELETLVPDVGDPSMEAFLFSNRSDLAFAAGDIQTAVRHQKSALKLIKELQMIGEHTTLTTLATYYLVAGDPAAALKATSKATALHRAQNFARPEGGSSQYIWWWHVQALIANGKTKEARKHHQHPRRRIAPQRAQQGRSQSRTLAILGQGWGETQVTEGTIIRASQHRIQFARTVPAPRGYGSAPEHAAHPRTHPNLPRRRSHRADRRRARDVDP
jgi:tetratricopeptide (TPR) repeat protein